MLSVVQPQKRVSLYIGRTHIGLTAKVQSTTRGCTCPLVPLPLLKVMINQCNSMKLTSLYFFYTHHFQSYNYNVQPRHTNLVHQALIDWQTCSSYFIIYHLEWCSVLCFCFFSFVCSICFCWLQVCMIIAASVSEPHTNQFNSRISHIYIYAIISKIGHPWK